MELLEAYALRGLREHDPKRPDLFQVAAERLRAVCAMLGVSEVGRISTLFRQLNIRDEALFQALGARLLLDLGAPRLLKLASSSASASASAPPPSLAMTASSAKVGQQMITASLSFLVACGRLSLTPPQLPYLFDIVARSALKTRDLPRLTALAGLAAKFGIQAHEVLQSVSESLAEGGLNRSQRSHGYASQAVFGQLLLALVFDETPCPNRDEALGKVVSAVFTSFGSSLLSLDERLARQLQVAGLACQLERPQALEILEARGLLAFLTQVARLPASDLGPLPKSSSEQHLQVSACLQELGVRHRLEEKILPYIADVRISTGTPVLIEIDGPLHFVGQTSRYDMKSALKHRLLSKQGWQVHHIAWNDWPIHHHSRLNYVARLLRSPAPPPVLLAYQPLSLALQDESGGFMPGDAASRHGSSESEG